MTPRAGVKTTLASVTRLRGSRSQAEAPFLFSTRSFPTPHHESYSPLHLAQRAFFPRWRQRLAGLPAHRNPRLPQHMCHLRLAQSRSVVFQRNLILQLIHADLPQSVRIRKLAQPRQLFMAQRRMQVVGNFHECHSQQYTSPLLRFSDGRVSSQRTSPPAFPLLCEPLRTSASLRPPVLFPQRLASLDTA